MHRTVRFVCVAAAFATVLAGCGKKPAPEPPAPRQQTPPPPPPPPAAQPQPSAQATDPNAELNRVRSTLGEPVYFAYDQSALSAEARAILDRKVTLLTGRSTVRIRVEGHADERGSDEYNLALGTRRAAAVKRYLTSRGLDASRFDVMSFGEERPSRPGHDEGSWARNRRAEFQILAGL